MLALILLGHCEKEPNPVKITDDHFLKALIKQGVDTNGDGKISHAEAKAIRSLDVSDESIVLMTGIEAFVNLDTLICERNQITWLDVSKSSALKYLSCKFNRLTRLHFPNNAALTSLYCTSNQLVYLGIANNVNLAELDCSHNELAELDVSNNASLTYLECSNNWYVTSLDVTANTALERFYCGITQITNLDVSNNTALEELDCIFLPILLF